MKATYSVVETAIYGRVTMEHVLASGCTLAKAKRIARMHGGSVRQEGK